MSAGTTEKVMAAAQRLFDVAGVTTTEDGNWLILGLASTPERDLDVFLRGDDGGTGFLTGFEEHVAPRLTQLLDSLRRQAIDAEVYGRCGYPRGDDVKLKQLAVAAGIGRWGRNSLVLHPSFGLSLRFMLVKTRGTRLSPTGSDRVTYQLSPDCASCNACQRACPLDLISDGLMANRRACLANAEHLTGTGKLSWCRLCIDSCPVGLTAR